MHTRRTVLGTTLAAASVTATAGLAQSSGSHMAGMSLDECADMCARSQRMCLETARYCLERAGSRPDFAALAVLLSDCAEICQTTADSLVRRSALHSILCDACARACVACALECAKLPQDEQLRRCAATCRECATSCEGMAKMSH